MTLAPEMPFPDDDDGDIFSSLEKELKASGSSFIDDDDFELPADIVIPDDISELDGSDAAASVAAEWDLDAELAAMTGEEAELAVVLTPVAEPKALAAACALVGLEVDAVPSSSGAVAVLSGKQGEGAEAAARAIAAAVPQLPILLVTKGAGQLRALRFHGSNPPEEVLAGLLVAGASGVLEDLLVGAVVPKQVPGTVSSVGLSHAKAMLWLASANRHHRRRH